MPLTGLGAPLVSFPFVEVDQVLPSQGLMRQFVMVLVARFRMSVAEIVMAYTLVSPHTIEPHYHSQPTHYPFIPAAAAAGAARAQRARWPVTWPVRAHGTARAAPPVRGEREDGLRGWPGVRGRDSRHPSSGRAGGAPGESGVRR